MSIKSDAYKEARFLKEEAEKDEDAKYHQFDNCEQYNETAWASPKLPNYSGVGRKCGIEIGSRTNYQVSSQLDQLAEETWSAIRDEFKEKNKNRYIIYNPKLGELNVKSGRTNRRIS